MAGKAKCELVAEEVKSRRYLFNNIVGLIEDGVLQGFSDMSFVSDYDHDFKTIYLTKDDIFVAFGSKFPCRVKVRLEAI